MSQTIELLELHLDSKKLLSDFDKTKKSMNEMKASTEALKKENDLLIESNKKLAKEGKKNTKEYEDNTNKINANKTAIKGLNTSIKETSKTYKTQEKAVNTWKQANEKGGQSINAMRKQLTLVTTEWTKLTAEEIKNTKKGRELNKAKTDLTANLKKVESATGDNRRNVGNYNDALQSSLPIMGSYGSQLGMIQSKLIIVKEGLNKMKESQIASSKATGTASKSLKTFKYALLATGIGAIVVALGLLFTAFTSTQRGADALSRALAPLKVGFQKLIGLAQDLSIKTVDAFKEPEQAVKDFGQAMLDNVINRFKSIITFGKAIGSIFEGDFDGAMKGLVDATGQAVLGMDSLSETASDFTDEVKKANEEAKILSDATINIEKLENKLVLARGRLNRKYQESMEIASDLSKSDEERLKASHDAIDAQTEITAKEDELLSLKIKKAKLEASFNDTSREDQKEINQLIADRETLYATSAKKRKSANSQIATIEKKALAEQKKLEQDLIKDIASLKNTSIEESLDAQIKAVEEENRIAIQGAKEKYKGKAELNQLLELLEQDRINKIAQLNKEADIKTSQDKLASLELLHKLELVSDEEYNQAKFEAEILAIQNSNEFKILSEQEQQDVLKAMRDDFNNQDIEATKETEITKAEIIQTAYDNLKSIASELLAHSKMVSDENVKAYDKQKQAELKLAGNDATKKAQIEAKYQKKIDAEKRKAFERDKGYKIAGVIMDTGKAIMGTWAGLSSMGIPGIIMAGIQTAFLTGLAGLQISTISGATYEHGGRISIGGKRHSDGGTQFYGTDGTSFEAEEGEDLFILNRRASKEINNLSAINEMFGGRSFGIKSSFLESGGGISRSTSIQTESDMNVSDISTALAGMPNPVVSVEEIVDVSNHMTEIRETNTF